MQKTTSVNEIVMKMDQFRYLWNSQLCFVLQQNIEGNIEKKWWYNKMENVKQLMKDNDSVYLYNYYLKRSLKST